LTVPPERAFDNRANAHWFLNREAKTNPKPRTMNSEKEQVRSLREMEEEVLAEGREWMRQRLQEKLQEQADRQDGVFPPERKESQAPAKREHASAHRRRRR
jgi:hypothetical protein